MEWPILTAVLVFMNGGLYSIRYMYTEGLAQHYMPILGFLPSY